MQISRGDSRVSVAGGPKLNDGKWHTVSAVCLSVLKTKSFFCIITTGHKVYCDQYSLDCLNAPCDPGATQLEVSNQDPFVILEVDGSNKLVVGMQSRETVKVLSGELRLALGGILIDKEKMLVQVGVTPPWDTIQ